MKFYTFIYFFSLIVFEESRSALATSFKPPSARFWFSDDKTYKLEITPPKFNGRESYFFFQNEDFITLRIAEGATNAETAAVKVAFSRLNKSTNYDTIWVRPSPSCKIPLNAFVISFHDSPIVIMEGEYGVTDNPVVPFIVFNLSGKCIANGQYLLPANNNAYTFEKKWSFDGENLIILGKTGQQIFKMRVDKK